MRIALIYDAVYPFVVGGVERRNYAVAEQLSGRHHVALYGFHYWAGDDRACLKGCRYVPVGRPVPLYASDGRRRIIEAVLFAGRLLKPLLRSNEDVWDIANFPFFSVPVAWLASLLRGRRLIVTWYEFWGDYWYQYLGWRGFLAFQIELLALRCSPRIIATSDMTRRRLVAAGYPIDRITTVPCGVDLQAVSEACEMGENYDLLCVGRLLPHKRVELAIDSLLHVRRSRPNATLAVVGDGPERERLERRAAHLELGNAVRFLGKLPAPGDVYAVMKSSRVLIAPSEREGFGIAVVEGWACGLPAVVCAGDENAMVELIDKSCKGRVVAPSAEGIAAACVDLLADPPRLHMGELYDCATAFDWRRIAQRLEEIYCSNEDPL